MDFTENDKRVWHQEQSLTFSFELVPSYQGKFRFEDKSIKEGHASDHNSICEDTSILPFALKSYIYGLCCTQRSKCGAASFTNLPSVWRLSISWNSSLRVSEVISTPKVKIWRNTLAWEHVWPLLRPNQKQLSTKYTSINLKRTD